MKYVLLLSKEDLKLAKGEVLSLFNLKKGKLLGNLLFLDLDNIEKADRLAYTRKVYQFLFESRKEELKDKVKEFDWESIYRKDFAVRIHNVDDVKVGVDGVKVWTTLKEKDLASIIWRGLSKPKVNLKNSKTLIEFFILKDRVYAAKLLSELKPCFDSRKAHKRPKLHPTALNPKLARALINLAGAEKEIMDPFCGSGGILLEAALIGIKPIGSDLYKYMIARAKINLDYFKIKGYKLIVQDALKINQKYDYIITDVPYGLNTSIWIKKGGKNQKISLKQNNQKERIKNLEEFYLSFLKNLKKILGRKAVVIFPNYVDYRELVKKANLRIEKEFSQFIHRSLTRKILVLS